MKLPALGNIYIYTLIKLLFSHLAFFSSFFLFFSICGVALHTFFSHKYSMMADSGPLSKRPRLEKGGGGGGGEGGGEGGGGGAGREEEEGGGGGGGGAIAGAKGGDAGVALEVLSVSSTLFSFYM